MKAKVTDRRFQLNLNEEEFKVLLASLEFLDRKLDNINQPQLDIPIEFYEAYTKNEERIRVNKQLSREVNKISKDLWKNG